MDAGGRATQEQLPRMSGIILHGPPFKSKFGAYGAQFHIIVVVFTGQDVRINVR